MPSFWTEPSRDQRQCTKTQIDAHIKRPDERLPRNTHITPEIAVEQMIGGHSLRPSKVITVL